MREWFRVNDKEAKLELQRRRIENPVQVVGPPPFSPYASVTRGLPKEIPLTAQIVLLIGLLLTALGLIVFNKNKLTKKQ